jgi:hypothetical protein
LKLKLDGCDLAYRKVTKNLEGEKELEKKRKQKTVDKLNDTKSEVSALTTKINKTTSGALKRHCVPSKTCLQLV